MAVLARPGNYLQVPVVVVASGRNGWKNKQQETCGIDAYISLTHNETKIQE